MTLKSTVTVAFLSLLLATVTLCAETVPANQANSPDVVTTNSESSYYVEISISRNLLTLYEIQEGADKEPIAEYTVGTAVRGLKTYPLGLGRVTGIYFNPWWYPTPYSRQVFRARGIEPPHGCSAKSSAELHGTVQDCSVTPDKQRCHLPHTRQQRPEACRPEGNRRLLRHEQF